jgi:hypothetical protein
MLTIKKDSLYVRWFVWAWNANPEKFNICKLSWGTIFFPVAFMSYKREFRVVPRLAILYLMVAATGAMAHWWAILIPFTVAAIGMVALSAGSLLFAHKHKAAPEQALTKVTYEGSRAADWLADHVLVPVFDTTDELVESEAGRMIGGFIGVVVEFIKATKKHYCPHVRVV